VNVLAVPAGPPVPELARVGVRRVSTGSLLASAAYGALLVGARELLSDGTSEYARSAMTPAERDAAFG
jgi:2-methylisocitrate lyase-like PEP mutase family enzyme